MNIYRLSHRAECPKGGLVDAYEIIVESPATIMVEDILAALKAAPKKVFQEELADFLRNRIGAKVTLVGIHHGVEIRSVRL
jgi:hypothetical protein